MHQLFLVTNQWHDLFREQLPPYYMYEEKVTTNYPVVQAIPLLSQWYLFNSSCARRSVFLCNSCFQQGSEYTHVQVIKNWFPWILVHNQCCNQQLWNEKRQPLFICCLYLQCGFEYAWLSLPLWEGNSFQYQLFTFMCWKKLLQIININQVVCNILWCISWPPISGCKINVDNIFQLKIALDCFVCVMLELFVCCHMFCACACVKYLILVQGQNHYLSGCPELLNGVGCFP